MGLLKVLAPMFFPFALMAQGESLKVGGMELSYTLRGDSVDISLSAPTLGWIGLGFNDQNSIVRSDLLLFHVVNGKTEAIDMHVVSAGNPKKDTALGGWHSIRIKGGQEMGNKTIVHFSIALHNDDWYDYQHELANDFWLILAYSTHDEFAHHSSMRKHVKYRFENN